MRPSGESKDPYSLNPFENHRRSFLEILRAIGVLRSPSLPPSLRSGAPGLPQDDNLAYGTQSAMKRLISSRLLAPRCDAHTSLVPSGLNMGKPSKPSA